MSDPLPYHCPLLKADFLAPPCEKQVARVDALLKKFPGAHLGPLEHCRDCRGKKLVKREVIVNEIETAPSPVTDVTPLSRPPGFYCKHHPTIEAHRDKNGKYMGLCRECLAVRAAANSRNRRSKPQDDNGGGGGVRQTAAAGKIDVQDPPAPPIPPDLACKNHPDRLAKIDNLGRNMRLCPECVAERCKRNAVNSQKSGVTAPPVSIPLNQAKYEGLREWLVSQAEENERTLQQQIMFSLKQFMRNHK